MSEINERWERDHKEMKIGAAYTTCLAIPLWIVSYQMSGPIYTMPQWQWFAAVSIFSLLAAVGCTIGAVVFVGMHLLESKPLEGANR